MGLTLAITLALTSAREEFTVLALELRTPGAGSGGGAWRAGGQGRGCGHQLPWPLLPLKSLFLCKGFLSLCVHFFKYLNKGFLTCL